MSGLFDGLRTGAWVTRERMRFVALAVLTAFTIGFGYTIVTAHDGIDFQGRPIGTDFASFYAAGTLVLDGQPQAPFDPGQQFARERALFGDTTQFYPFLYPPFFLLVAEALALLPYLLALALWQGVTLLLYLGVIYGIVAKAWPSLRPDHGAAAPAPDTSGSDLQSGPTLAVPHRAVAFALLQALAFPAVFVNLGHGQNGFLTAALLGGALLLLDRRPVLAGLLIGLLAYKPQLGLMIPIALVAAGRWRTIAAAVATVVVFVAAIWLIFGSETWSAFLASTASTRTDLLEQGAVGWYKSQSVLAWTRLWGGSVPLAYAMQGAATLAAAAAIAWLWWRPGHFAPKAAGLALATMLAAPYNLDYDMMVLAPAIAFVAADGLAHGFRSWEKSALAGLWLVPLVTRSVAEWTLIPLGVPMMIAMFLLVLRRAAATSSVPAPSLSAQTP
jgi:glycosyl transferase family 87